MYNKKRKTAKYEFIYIVYEYILGTSKRNQTYPYNRWKSQKNKEWEKNTTNLQSLNTVT